MNIRQLEYFTGTVEQKGFTKASEHLFVSQPSISKAICSLENEFNVQLINRKSSAFQLTPAGIIFYESAKRILDDYNKEIDNLHRLFLTEKGA